MTDAETGRQCRQAYERYIALDTNRRWLKSPELCAKWEEMRRHIDQAARGPAPWERDAAADFLDMPRDVFTYFLAMQFAAEALELMGGGVDTKH